MGSSQPLSLGIEPTAIWPSSEQSASGSEAARSGKVVVIQWVLCSDLMVANRNDS